MPEEPSREEPDYTKTSEQILMDCMALCADEPGGVQHVVVVLISGGDIIVRSNARRAYGTGMLELGKHMVMGTTSSRNA